MKKGTIIGFITGIFVGAGLGLVLAPKSGKETRKDIANKAKELKNKAKNIDLDDIREFVVEKSADIEEKLSKLSKEKVLKDAKKLAKVIEKDMTNLCNSVKGIKEDVMQDSIELLKEKTAKTIEKVLKKLKED